MKIIQKIKDFGNWIKKQWKKVLVILGIGAILAAGEILLIPEQQVIIQFNPTGTHIKDGQLKIRIDIYPVPGMASYERQTVDVANEPVPEGLTDEQYEQWWNAVPKHKVLNPMLSHFIAISDDTTKEEIEQFINKTFTDEFLATIDANLVLPDALHRISPLMKDKSVLSDKKTKTATVEQINAKMGEIQILKQVRKIEGEPTIPQSISVGSPATDRDSASTIGQILFSRAASNGTGTIDTANVFLVTGYPANIYSEIGTIYVTSPYSSRDYESTGAILAGSMQTLTGLSIDIQTGDYIGIVGGGNATPRIERDSGTGASGSAGPVATANFPFTNLAATSRTYDSSINGTGVESGGDNPDYSDLWIKSGTMAIKGSQTYQMTFYPDANPETTSVDGTVAQIIGSEPVWNDFVNGTGNSVDSTSASGADIYIRAGAVSPKWYQLGRSIFVFDTSGLPDDANIETVTFSIYGSAKLDNLGVTPDINIYSSAPVANNDLVAGDYDSLGSTAFSTTITYAGWSTTGYNNFIFNASGITAISKTGASKLGVRNASYDVASTSPAWGGAYNISSLSGYFAEQAGISQDPKLVVTYTLPSVVEIK